MLSSEEYEIIFCFEKMTEKTVNIGKIIHVTTIDWHGKVSMIIFLRGCPLRCVYCQNYKILEGEDIVPLDHLKKEIENAIMFIDAVVLSGGEPLMQHSAAEEIAAFAKSLHLGVGIQTNGFYPDVIDDLLDKKLVDKFFLDVKAPLSSDLYEKVTKSKDASERVKESLMLLDDRKADFEAVTTVFPDLVEKEHVIEISRELDSICDDLVYVIQQGIPEHAREEFIRSKRIFSREEIIDMAMAAAEVFTSDKKREIKIRTREEGEETVFSRETKNKF